MMVVVVLATAGLIGWGVIAQQRTSQGSRLTVLAGVVDDGAAWQVGTGPVTVDIYEGFLCPACRDFQDQTGTTIKQLITDGKINVRYHTVAILDDSSSGTSAGLTSDTFADAVTSKKYDAWVATVTDQFLSRGFTGTPTIVVAGTQLTDSSGGVPTTAEFIQAVTQAAG
ncbi:MAG TPA: thioredoxin domain-containing protein [Micromonospora sp.]